MTHTPNKSGQALVMAAISVLCLLIQSEASAQVTDADVATDFEFTDMDGFTLGTAPKTVTFSDGQSKTVGRPPLYRSGFFSFMTPNGATSAIEFQTPAAAVQFYANQEAMGVDGLIEVYDPGLNLLDTVDITAVTSGPFQNVLLQQSALGSSIGRITVSNNSVAATPQYLVIDDFSFRAVPEPSSLAILGIGSLALLASSAVRTRRRRQ